jgi:hypothetical protein
VTESGRSESRRDSLAEAFSAPLTVTLSWKGTDDVPGHN